MKQLFPLTLALLVAACVAPKPGTEAHQRQLAKEARENFYALKAAERKNAPPASENRDERIASDSRRIDVEAPFRQSRRTETTRRARPADDTVYYFDMPRGGPEPTSPRYQAYKLQYARELAKSPGNLTSEEREWVRRHYQDQR